MTTPPDLHRLSCLLAIVMTLTGCTGDPVAAEEGAGTATARSTHSAGRFTLELGGTTAGFVKTVDAGLTMDESASATERQVITIEMSELMTYDFYGGWAAHGPAARRNGAIEVSTAEGRRRISFTGATVTEVKFHDLDANRDPWASAQLTVKFETERVLIGPGRAIPSEPTPAGNRLSASNFRVSVDGHRLAVSRVRGVRATFGSESMGPISITLPAADVARLEAAKLARIDYLTEDGAQAFAAELVRPDVAIVTDGGTLVTVEVYPEAVRFVPASLDAKAVRGN